MIAGSSRNVLILDTEFPVMSKLERMCDGEGFKLIFQRTYVLNCTFVFDEGRKVLLIL